MGIVLAAVFWQANSWQMRDWKANWDSWDTQSWTAVESCGGQLQPWCGGYGTLMITNMWYGKQANPYQPQWWNSGCSNQMHSNAMRMYGLAASQPGPTAIHG